MATKKCPVCGSEIKGSGVQARINGKQVIVCCEQCAKEAQEHPAEHAQLKK